jgi:hypothetical protein
MKSIIYLAGLLFSNFMYCQSYLKHNYFVINKSNSAKMILFTNKNPYPFSKKYYHDYIRRLNSKICLSQFEINISI